MFSHFTRLSLRRCVHTASTAPRPWSRTAKVVFGTSAATATYMTWRLTNERNHLALDSVNPTKITRDSTISPNPSLPPDPEFTTSDTKSPDSFTQSPEQPETQSGSPEETSGGSSESSGGAFNPQTGEINWDCPCLGGMAHGPCGPEFREAFSCFVFSEVEPKGIDCVEKFKSMQTCFRAHPEDYPDEIMDEDDEPVHSENSEGLPPEVGSSEQIANETGLSSSTPEKPHLQKAGSRDDAF